MGICVGCQYCPKKSWSGCTWGDHFKTIHLGITRDDLYGPPLDLADVKLEDVNVNRHLRNCQLHSQSLPVICSSITNVTDSPS